MGIETYSTTPGSNTALFPEGMPPSAVNDSARQLQADQATWYLDPQFIKQADTPVYVSTTSFTVSTDKTAVYTANRRIKCNDASTLYCTVVSSSYSNPNTTVTVTLDSGSLSASLSAVAISILTPSNGSIPTALGKRGSTVASASTINLSTAAGDFIDVSGTTTITAITSEAAGIERTVRFTGALTLTHNATSLILPGSANLTTANGDIAIFRSLGSGNWVCINYTPFSIVPTFTAPTIQRITATGAFTYTATSSNVLYAIFELQGAGGGSGGAGGGGSVGAVGGGGGGGGYLRLLVSGSANLAAITGSVGAGGSAGDSGITTDGGAGGNTTLTINSGTQWVAGGGNGGARQGATGSATHNGAAAGGANTTGTNGTLLHSIIGGDASMGIIQAAASLVNAFGSAGGPSFLSNPVNCTANNGVGANAGHLYGGGASGASNGTGANVAGAAGANGVVVVTEYYQ
jgi:hypothetical protein